MTYKFSLVSESSFQELRADDRTLHPGDEYVEFRIERDNQTILELRTCKAFTFNPHEIIEFEKFLREAQEKKMGLGDEGPEMERFPKDTFSFTVNGKNLVDIEAQIAKRIFGLTEGKRQYGVLSRNFVPLQWTDGVVTTWQCEVEGELL